MYLKHNILVKTQNKKQTQNILNQKGWRRLVRFFYGTGSIGS